VLNGFERGQKDRREATRFVPGIGMLLLATLSSDPAGSAGVAPSQSHSPSPSRMRVHATTSMDDMVEGHAMERERTASPKRKLVPNAIDEETDIDEPPAHVNGGVSGTASGSPVQGCQW
jgi:hypothetical protein